MNSFWSRKVHYLVALSFLTTSNLASFNAVAAVEANGGLQKWVAKNSATGLMKPQDLQIIMDNDRSFQEKLSILQQAEAGDRVYMKYYIHSNDESTSVLNQAMIDAAKRGAKVNLMLDFATNYSHLDLLNMMAERAGGNLDIRMFSPPAASIGEDAMYMTTNCKKNPAQCIEEKQKNVEEAKAESIARRGRGEVLGAGQFFSRLFIAGLSTKNAGAMKTALSVAGTLPDMGSDEQKMTPEKKQKLVEFFKILIGAKILKNTKDKVKLAIASTLYADDVGPLLEAIDKALPLSTEKETPSGKDWEEITQFTHHKEMTLVKGDGSKMIVLNGGRNLENSYHLNENNRDMIAKYLFYDTDIRFEVTDRSEIQRMEQASAEFFNYKPLVATLKEVNMQLPIDPIKESELLNEVLKSLESLRADKNVSANEFASAVEKKFNAELAIRGLTQKRRQAEFANMKKNAQEYLRQYSARDLNVRSAFPSIVEGLSQQDRDAKIAYVENLPYDDGSRMGRLNNRLREILGLPSKEIKRRVYNPIPGQEEKSNKNIHGLWIQWIKDQALKSKGESEPRHIIINQGYSYFPSDLVDLFAQLMDGRIDASNLKITLITNSIETTDLSVMNIMARHQFKAMMDYYVQHQGKEKGKGKSLNSFEIFEYQSQGQGKITSAHSKAIYTKDSFFIGSANADVRSYETDSNNGLFVMDAPKTAQKMVQNIEEKILKDSRIVKNVTNTFKRTHAEFLKEDMTLVRSIVSKYKKFAGRAESVMGDFAKTLVERMTEIYLMTGVIANPKEAPTWLGRQSTVQDPSSPNANLSGAQLQCKRVFEAGARREYLNKTNEVRDQIKNLMNQSPEGLRRNFDRANQLM